MRNRDFGVVALGRFLAVERYQETHLSDRTGGHADTAGLRSGSRAPARTRQG
jgi:hypothetical protein